MISEQDTKEREKLEFDSLPEFIREPYTSVKDSYVTAPVRSERFYERYREDDSQHYAKSADYASSYPPAYDEHNYAAAGLSNKSAELETLWPGTTHNHQEFLPPAKRSVSMYLTIGFMAGACVSLIGVWIISLFNHSETPTVAQANQPASKKIVVATSAQSHATQSAPAPVVSAQPQPVSKPQASAPANKNEDVIPELIVPTVSSYEVQNGDTLAGIIYKTYKRVSPRLLDTICRANGMANADKLTLGQKLTLPEYRPIRTQVATRSNSNM